MIRWMVQVNWVLPTKSVSKINCLASQWYIGCLALTYTFYILWMKNINLCATLLDFNTRGSRSIKLGEWRSCWCFGLILDTQRELKTNIQHDTMLNWYNFIFNISNTHSHNSWIPFHMVTKHKIVKLLLSWTWPIVNVRVATLKFSDEIICFLSPRSRSLECGGWCKRVDI